VFGDGVDQRSTDIRSRAVHDEGDVLVDHAFERDQRFGRLQLVVDRHQLEFLAERAAHCVLARDDELEVLQKFIAAGGERARKRIGIADLDGVFGGRRPSGNQQPQEGQGTANQAPATHRVSLPNALPLAGRFTF